MRVRVRLFARLRELARHDELEIEAADGATVDDVWRDVVSQHPELDAYSGTISCAVNDEYVKRARELREGDEVAFLPPVSGG